MVLLRLKRSMHGSMECCSAPFQKIVQRILVGLGLTWPVVKNYHQQSFDNHEFDFAMLSSYIR
jgi:hypothetical protein